MNTTDVIIVEQTVIIELKSVERVLPVHEAQTLTRSGRACPGHPTERQQGRAADELQQRHAEGWPAPLHPPNARAPVFIGKSRNGCRCAGSEALAR